MDAKIGKSDRIAAICGMAWFLLIIDACFTWSLPDSIRWIIGFLFISLGSVVLSQNNGLNFSKLSRWPAFSVILLIIYFIGVKFRIYHIFEYSSLLLFSLWRPSALMKMFFYFRKFVIFYAGLSVFVEVLFVSGVWKNIPYLMVYPPQDLVQESHGMVNYFYGLFCIPIGNTSRILYRACGPLREGGHWIFFLGFTYFVEKALYNKRNVWLILCGLLSLSPNFIIFFGGTEAYCLFKQKKFLKPFLGVIGIVVFVFLSYSILPQVIKNEITRIVFERSLEASIENVDSDGLMALLDGRAGYAGLNNYYIFEHSSLKTKMLGVAKFDYNTVMSDYRWMLMSSGYIGTLVVLLCSYCFSICRERNLYGVLLFLFALAIFLQRAWMFNTVYIWAMMLMVVNMKYILERSRQSVFCK